MLDHIGVADWQKQLTEILPEDMKSSLPTIEEIEREMKYTESQMVKTDRARRMKLQFRHQSFLADAAKAVCEVLYAEILVPVLLSAFLANNSTACSLTLGAK